MTELVRFIKARLAEDELWALAASRPPEGIGPQGSTATPDPVGNGVRWQWRYGNEYVRYDTPSEPEPGCVTGPGEVCWLSTVEEFPVPDSDDDDEKSPGLYSQGILDMDLEAAVHIARHDPSRTIRNVRNERKLLQRCIQVVDGSSAPASPEVKLAMYVIRMMAAKHARHADYQQSWRP